MKVNKKLYLTKKKFDQKHLILKTKLFKYNQTFWESAFINLYILSSANSAV